MLRQNRFGRAVDERRWGQQVFQLPAEDVYKLGYPPVSGAQVASAYRFLAHYTTLARLAQMLQAGQIGGSAGCFYARYFEELPSVSALANELGPPLKNAWQHAVMAAAQLPQIEEQRAKFMANLRDMKLLDEG